MFAYFRSSLVRGRRYLGLFIGFILCFLCACTEQVKMDITGSNENLPTGPSAITWDGKNLLIAKDGLIVFIDNIDTATAGSIYKYEGHYFLNRQPITVSSQEKPSYISGIAWQKTSSNGGYIWIADNSNRRLMQITPQGEVIRKIAYSKFFVDDMTFDGETLWIADSKREKIFRISLEDGSILEQFQSPVKTPTALAWDGKQLYIAGLKDLDSPSYSSDNIRIVKLSPKTGKVTEEIPPSRYLSQPTGMVWIEGKLWIADRNYGGIIITSDWGSPSEDTKDYRIATLPVSSKKIQQVEKKAEKQDIDEAKRAAEEARQAAEEAKKAAEAAKKAFELQQKK
ncbi:MULTISPECIES: hypothetical protein [Thermodesulfovibrio]|jgi:hypothetical protein|uniref:hypothetical protein n=1 Tax=Thermodesulfovibrio TaxID=28261 RepID=UPI00262DA3A7|nr:hypothetical protein [Thermodesulfovibrio sp.]